MKRTLLLILCLMLQLAGCSAAAPAIKLATPTDFPTYTPRPTLTLLPTYTPQPEAPSEPTAAPQSDSVAFPADMIISSDPTQALPIRYVTVTPFAAATAIVPRTPLDQEVVCGDQLGITLTFMIPKIQGSLTAHYPLGKFLLMRVRLRSTTDAQIDPLKSESFSIAGSLYGRDVTVSLDRGNSNYANTRWETPNLDYPIGAKGIETFLVFDVHPEMTNFTLVFEPFPVSADQPLCSLRLPLPIAYD